MESLINSWIQLGAFVVATLVFMWYMRKDSKDDYIRLDTKLEAWRREFKEDSQENNRRIEGLIAAIHEEMKDFHGRLCALEEKNKGK